MAMLNVNGKPMSLEAEPATPPQLTLLQEPGGHWSVRLVPEPQPDAESKAAATA